MSSRAIKYRCSLRVRTHSGSDVKSCLYQNTIHGGGDGWNKGFTPPRKRVAWKKLRKERKKFSKLLIFSTDCSQPMELQSVIKIRGKTSKLFVLHASPYKGSTPGWILVALRILDSVAIPDGSGNDRIGQSGGPMSTRVHSMFYTPL